MLRVSVLGGVLALALAAPAAAQIPNVQQLLQGLTTGNQGQDQALRDAFERGYQRGRQDEARMRHSDRRESYRDDRGSRDDRGARDDRGYRDDRGPDPSLGRQGGGSYTR